MATSAVAGFKGVIKASSASTSGTVVAIAEVKNWNINMELSEIEATSHDSSGSAEKIPGVSSWGGDAEYLQVMGSTQHKNLFDAVTNRRTLAWEFYPTGSSSDGYYNGSAFLTNWTLGSPNEDALMTNINFAGTGALTRSSSST